MYETAIHLIDTFRFLFGEVEGVFGSLRTLNPVVAGEDAGLVIFNMRNGVSCLFDGNRLSDHKADNRLLTMGELLVEGEGGVLSFDGDGVIEFRAHGSNKGKVIEYGWANIDFGGDCVHALQRHIIESRLGRGVVENSGSEYLLNIQIEEAIYASHDARRYITL